MIMAAKIQFFLRMKRKKIIRKNILSFILYDKIKNQENPQSETIQSYVDGKNGVTA